VLERLTRQIAPQLLDAFGIAADTAAEMLIVAGDNPERIRTEAAWPKLCGVAPIGHHRGRQPGTGSTADSIHTHRERGPLRRGPLLCPGTGARGGSTYGRGSSSR
jgi:hypothetical protein